jgi:secondary thiamine-phosphate synthase enzyme
MNTTWIQKEVVLRPYPRGFHLITREALEAVPEMAQIKTGWAQIFVQHTSASLSLNENADPDVRRDLETYFDQAVPEHAPWVTHTLEGPDDMPAHIKAAMLGCSVQFPITDGRPNLGTWQGLYLCEHRNHAGSRRLIVTVAGETA